MGDLIEHKQALFRGVRSSFGILGRACVPLLLWVWVFGFLIFEVHVLSFSQPNSLISADAIVVFTGSDGRIQKAMELLKKGVSPRLLVSGAPASKESVLVWGGQNLPITFDRAANTKDNVRGTRTWVNSLGVQSIYLVTWDQHLPRCLLLFQRSNWLKKIIVFPVRWETPSGLFYSFLEYHKFIIFLGLGE